MHPRGAPSGCKWCRSSPMHRASSWALHVCVGGAATNEKLRLVRSVRRVAAMDEHQHGASRKCVAPQRLEACTARAPNAPCQCGSRRRAMHGVHVCVSQGRVGGRVGVLLCCALWVPPIPERSAPSASSRLLGLRPVGVAQLESKSGSQCRRSGVRLPRHQIPTPGRPAAPVAASGQRASTSRSRADPSSSCEFTLPPGSRRISRSSLQVDTTRDLADMRRAVAQNAGRARSRSRVASTCKGYARSPRPGSIAYRLAS